MKLEKVIVLACFVVTQLTPVTESAATPTPPTAPPTTPAAAGTLGGAILKRLGFYGVALQSLGCMAGLQGDINALDALLAEIEELGLESSKVFEEVLRKIAQTGCDQPKVAQALMGCLTATASEESRLRELFNLLVGELSIGNAVLGFCPFVGTGSPIWGQMQQVIAVAQNLRDLKEDEVVCLRQVSAKFGNLQVSCSLSPGSGTGSPNTEG